jgi:hypothetical protein
MGCSIADCPFEMGNVKGNEHSNQHLQIEKNVVGWKVRRKLERVSKSTVKKYLDQICLTNGNGAVLYLKKIISVWLIISW